MSLSDELHKLDELDRYGVLSNAEFFRAKDHALGHAEPTRSGAGIASLNTLQRSRSDRWFGGRSLRRSRQADRHGRVDLARDLRVVGTLTGDRVCNLHPALDPGA